MRPFQIILIGIFAFLAVAGFVVLTNYSGSSDEEKAYGSSVEIWGTLDKKAF